MTINKYRAKKIKIDGLTFDSKKEASRYFELLAMQKAGIVCDLQRQVKFKICDKAKEKNSRERFYIADFVYIQDGFKIIEDVKSAITKKEPLYRLKRQLVLVLYPDYVFREV